MNSESFNLFLLPLPEVVLFPGMSLPLLIYEDDYRQLVLDCMNKKIKLGIILMEEDQIKEIGTIADIIHTEKAENKGLNTLVEGKERFKVLNLINKEPYIRAEVEIYSDKETILDKQLQNDLKTVKQLTKKALNIFDSISGK